MPTYCGKPSALWPGNDCGKEAGHAGLCYPAFDRSAWTDVKRLRKALQAVIDRVDAECEGAQRQMLAGDYRLCPPDMLRVYISEAIAGALSGETTGAKS